MFTYDGNSFAGKDDTDSVHLIVCLNKRYFFALVQSHRQTSFPRVDFSRLLSGTQWCSYISKKVEVFIVNCV